MGNLDLVYSDTEAISSFKELQDKVKKGIIPRIVNTNTNETIYMINQKIFESLIDKIEANSILNFDEHLGVYTIFNKIVPQIFGEGLTEMEAIDQMIDEAKTFVEAYAENIDLSKNIFDGQQQLLIGYILQNLEDDFKIRKILNVL